MRIFLLLAFVAVARAASLRKSLVPWEEWDVDLRITGPGTQTTSDSPRVCWDADWDGNPVQLCCEGYTGRVEDGCPTPVCNSPCQNGGTCAAPDHCVCTKAYTGDTCSTLKKEYRWSDWVNLDRENIIGDFETLYHIRAVLDVCKNSVPEDIECQTEEGIDHTVLGQVLTCDRRLGLKCRNDEQPSPDTHCLDYRVRILCPVKDVATKTGFTCIQKTLEYSAREVVKEGDCSACECQLDGRWECHRDEDYCDTPISTTPAPQFSWLPSGVQTGQCIVGETVFNHGDTTTLDCKMCTCDMTNGWSCVDIDDPTCVAPPDDDYCRIDNHFIFFHGQTAKKDCNTCICKNSKWDCTQTICPDKTNRMEYFLRCVNPETNNRHDDGEIVKRDCNVCVCTQGKWECTRDPCEEGTSLDTDTTLSTKKVCTTPTGLPYPHGATIGQDCNACKCFDGKWLCTRRFCSPETYPNSTCVDEVTTSLVKSGQTIRRGCNVCLCNGGNLTCTTKPCESNTGVCFDEQRRFATTSTSFDRQYRPVCNSDGTFSPIQCNPLHGVCFCVTTLGHVIPGTSVRQGTGSPNCSPYTIGITNPLHFTMPSTQTGNFPCIETTQDTTTRLTGYNTPKCLPNGDFAPLQCDPHTGVCYCVTQEGTTIPGTVLHVSQGRPNCDVARDDIPVSTTTELKTPCRQERDNAELYKLPFVPECDETGRYQPLQINRMLNIRFCVDVNGVVLEQTISKSSFMDCASYSHYVHEDIKPYTNKMDPDNEPYTLQTYPVKDMIHKTPRCKLQRLISQFVSSVYRPSCQEDGRFSPEQCPSNTDLCFCVDVTGAIIPETMRRVGYAGVNCNDYSSVFDVVTPTNTTTVMIHPDVSLTHSGWEPKLTEIDHPRHMVGRQYTRTTKPRVFKTNVTSCIRQQQIATMVPGVFYPSCHRNGTFNTMQHQPLSREVYCVDKNGVKIEGTERRVDFQPMPDCTPYWNTTVDMTKVSKHWTSTPHQDTMVTKPIPLDSLFPAGLHHHPNCTRQQEITSRLEGAVVPTCEPNGTYTPLQCNATTGVCYCMLPYGDVLPDTVLPMVKGTPSCWHLRNVSILQSTTPVPDVCRLPVVKGPCRARFIRWAFSKLLNKCHMFVYSGCRGNDNHFETIEECQSTCGYLTPPTDPRPLTCERKLARFNRMNFAQRLTMKRPLCTPDGNYKPKQCHLSRTDDGMFERVCECVHRATGEVQVCEEEGTRNLNLWERVVVSTTPAPIPEIDGCISEGVMYHRDDEFFQDCNSCVCLGNNQAACTRKYCPSYNCYRFGMVETQYERGCEECNCIGGSWDCQMKPNCNPDQRPAPDMGTATECHRDNGKVMTIGSFYYNDCNKCTCMSHGHVTCETNYCIPRHCYHEGTPYHTEDKIMNDCNECTCYGGQWQCQDYTCDPIIRTRVRLEGCEYKEEAYTNGQTFYDRCNLCRCLGNNATSCDREYCSPSSCFVKEVEIRNTQSQTIDCRTCTCHNGLLECVEDAECLHVMVHPIVQVNLDSSIKCQFEGKTYTNGDQFWKQCKPCRCFDDGEVQCEDKACSPNLCYEEGVAYLSGDVLLTDLHQCTCFRGGHWDCVDKPQDAGRPDVIECPSERPAISCLTNPCDGRVCPTRRDAVCVPDYCGHCLPVFFDQYGNRLRC
ncbi:kielin/chordin-like protein [Patiria miniata]|uniref:Kielin/chordin-like protein n=1 Tax=Patiria miniata TaxID=46514 RepID=A0A914AXH4_PATMI|nr:kielin/chordin-like protein [Patiria miniata]